MFNGSLFLISTSTWSLKKKKKKKKIVNFFFFFFFFLLFLIGKNRHGIGEKCGYFQLGIRPKFVPCRRARSDKVSFCDRSSSVVVH